MMSFANSKPLAILQARIVLCEKKLLEHITPLEKELRQRQRILVDAVANKVLIWG